MIFWNDIRFACESCTKGHIAAKCSHSNRAVVEIKSKGRPQSQCPSCREKRIHGSGHAHHKCRCGLEPPKEYIYKIKSMLNINSVLFENQLELQFQQKPTLDLEDLKQKVEQKQSFEIQVSKGKNSNSQLNEVCTLVPNCIIVTQEQVENELDSMKNNPCRCHYDGKCICAQLPMPKRERKSDKRIEVDIVNSLLKLKESNVPTGSGGGGCCSSISAQDSQSPQIYNSCCSNNSSSCCSSGCNCSSLPTGCNCNH